jgi:arylsulfatase A-like enzyme/Flp pilus assembly protein TadD
LASGNCEASSSRGSFVIHRSRKLASFLLHLAGCLLVVMRPAACFSRNPGPIAAPAASAQALTAERNHPKPDVLFLTIDTLRADHLRCYGGTGVETPNIDALARSGIRFTRAFTPVPITLPAHTAIFTGSFPMATGMHDFSGNKLPSGVLTLARLLHDNGYATAAFIGAAVLDSRFGLNQGFDTYYDHFDFSRLDETNLDLTERRGDEVVSRALAWLKEYLAQPGVAPATPRKPFFLWVHLYDPHFPYHPPEPYATRYRSHLYDGEIAFADAQVGRLLTFLKQQGVFDTAAIVVAGDHGEGLGEHGEKTHGFFIYNSTLHVPLLLRIPGVRPRVVDDEVSLVDVMPTLLQEVKITPPATVQGRSLLGLALGRSQPGGASSELYAETYLPLLHFGWSRLRGVQGHGLKYIDAPQPELYDTRADPHELKNLFHDRQAAAQERHEQLLTLIRRYTPRGGSAAGSKELTDPALLERLRSLGYVAVSAGTFTEANGKPLPDPKDRVQTYELFSEAMSDGQHGRYRESLEKLAQAEKADPALLAIRYLQALDFYRLKDYSQAIAKFRAALELDPKFALASYYLGLAQVQTGDLEGAAGSFGRALELDPTNFSAAYNLGAVELKKGHLDQALAYFQRAVAINPDYAQGQEALGEMYLYQKRNEDAIRALERAVEVAPGFGKAHYNLGRAYQAAGRIADAQRQFNQAGQQ